MFDYDSCCDTCIYCKRIPAKTNAPAEDCYPAEDWCENESDNYGSRDGCRYYERDPDKEAVGWV